MDHLKARWSKPAGSDGFTREAKSLGGQLIEAESFKAWLQNGSVGNTRFRVPGSILPEQNNLFTSTFGDSSITNIPGIGPLPRQKLRIRDLIPSKRITSGSDSQFLRQLASTGAASPQVEASAKAEAQLNFELQTATYKTLAVWTRASKQILDDVDELKSAIDKKSRVQSLWFALLSHSSEAHHI